MSLKALAMKFEKVCQVRKLYLHVHRKDDHPCQLPVVTEHALTEDHCARTKEAEFFRARAFKGDGTSNTDFHTYDNSVSVTVCHSTRTVMFGPYGAISMQPRGVRLGPALMAKVIEWLHDQGLHSYAIQKGLLSATHATTTDERLQRNRFYMAFGFSVSSFSGVQGEGVTDGSFSAQSVGHLSVPERYRSMLTPWLTFDSQVLVERLEAIHDTKTISKVRDWHKGITRFTRWALRRSECPL